MQFGVPHDNFAPDPDPGYGFKIIQYLDTDPDWIRTNFKKC